MKGFLKTCGSVWSALLTFYRDRALVMAAEGPAQSATLAPTDSSSLEACFPGCILIPRSSGE